MALRPDSMKRSLSAFGRWWLAELRRSVPDSLWGRLTGWRRRLLATTDGESLAFIYQGRALGEVLLSSGGPRVAGAGARTLLDDLDDVYDELVLRIADDRILRRRLRLPIVARDSLAEAVGYDIDRQTPFTPEQVYYGVREIAVDRSAGQIEAELEIVRRDDVDPALATLDSAGLVPDRIDTRDEGPDLSPPPLRRGRGTMRRRVAGSLALLAAGLLIAAAWLPRERVEAEIAEVEAEIALARQEALEVDRLLREIDAYRSRQAELFARKQREPMVLNLLAEVTEALPDDVFLLEFGYDGGRVTLSGYAAKASDVLGWIEEAEHLGGARFLSPVTQDRRVGRERFTVAAEALAVDAPAGRGALP